MFCIPVWVLKCACKDFSLGNTRLQKRHLIALGDVKPSTIKLLIASALGLPLLFSCLAEKSGELHELPGLNSIFTLSSAQFQLYSSESFFNPSLHINSSREMVRVGVVKAILQKLIIYIGRLHTPVPQLTY